MANLRVPETELLGSNAEGRINELPVNHNPSFAPIIRSTLQTGTEAMVVGELAWLAK